MPWERKSVMSQREEFVKLARELGNIAEACRRFDISRPTGYKWLNRYETKGKDGLKDRSTRPKRSPNQTPEVMEKAVLTVRRKHKTWGGRKIKHRLIRLGYDSVPAASTITEILRRNDQLDPKDSEQRQADQRFEAERPNDLWQMDFKGHFPLEEGRCHPLTVLDDHSRYSLGLKACENERHETVQSQCKRIFQKYGMPRKILADNGGPWGRTEQHPWTRLTVWWMELGIQVTHSSPYHPQTLGKDERFHRTFKADIQGQCEGMDLNYCQDAFDDWRAIYNHQRPHEALDMDVPIDRYKLSKRAYPGEKLEWDYGSNAVVRKVSINGRIEFEGTKYKVGKPFIRKYVELRENNTAGKYNVYFREQRIKQIDQRKTDD